MQQALALACYTDIRVKTHDKQTMQDNTIKKLD